MIRTYPEARKLQKSAVALAALLFAASSFAHQQSSALEMTVISDEAFGDAVVAGEYGTAIEQIEALENAGSFFASNNLCVAYTKSGNFESARSACDTAVGKTHERRLRHLDGRTARRYAAMALSNRGVLLALAGERELALDDIRSAVRLRSRIAAPRRNLEFIETRTTGATLMLQTDR